MIELFLVFLQLCLSFAEQIHFPSIDQMPSLPSPLQSINWEKLAENYDAMVYLGERKNIKKRKYKLEAISCLMLFLEERKKKEIISRGKKHS